MYELCAHVHFSREKLCGFHCILKGNMTRKRLRTILVQPPHVIGEEIESREENVCLRSHSQNQTQVS